MFMADLIGLLIAAGGPSRLPLRASWTLHRAVGELGERARQLDGYGCLPEIHVASDSQVGTAVTGIAVGLHELMARGEMRVAGEGWECTVELSSTAHRYYRKALMGLEPRLAELIYDAGSNWAALALTAEKNWKTALASLGRRRRSETPKRLQLALSVVR